MRRHDDNGNELVARFEFWFADIAHRREFEEWLAAQVSDWTQNRQQMIGYSSAPNDGVLDKAHDVVRESVFSGAIRELAQLLANHDGITYVCPCSDPACQPARPVQEPRT